MMRQTKAKLIFCITKAGAHVLERREKSKERKRRKKRKKKEKEKKSKPRYVFVFNSWVFWISYGLVWRLVLLWSRVLWRNHINPRILKVMRVKPNWCKINVESS